MTRYRFDISLHVRSADAQAGETVSLAGRDVETLALPAAARGAAFAVSFEEAAAALAPLPRMFVEPDGSFVWTGEDQAGRWQVDGNLYDRAGRLLYVELAGDCPAAEFDRLLAPLGWPGTAVMFQLKRQGVWLDETAFRAWAAGCT
ncbi:MAG: hypothetical protein AB7U73_13705 [Pirellulales bacterium]